MGGWVVDAIESKNRKQRMSLSVAEGRKEGRKEGGHMETWKHGNMETHTSSTIAFPAFPFCDFAPMSMP